MAEVASSDSSVGGGGAAAEVAERQPNPAAAVKMSFTPPASPRATRSSGTTLNAISGAALARMSAQAARYFGDYENEMEETGIETFTEDGIVHPYSALRIRCKCEETSALPPSS